MNDYSKITALYSRLSVGDQDRDGGESNSIEISGKLCQTVKADEYPALPFTSTRAVGKEPTPDSHNRIRIYSKAAKPLSNLNQRYLALKEEVKEAEKIRKSVYNILRQEQREQQPRRAQDMER